MSDSNSKCIGIDLTQNVPWVATAKNCEFATYKEVEQVPPAALLPFVQGESLIVGEEASLHRRGGGAVWPPECQIPVNYDFINGVGRIPLVCAWTKLASFSKQKFSGKLGDTEISWHPSGNKRLFSTAEKIIAESANSWSKRYGSEKTVLVVPDSLGEAAQQALIDKSDSFLIPRSVAVAMSWCRKNTNEFNGKGIVSKRGVPIGHLLVVTLAFDQWEVVPLEIRAKIYKEKLWLFPVRNSVRGGGEIPQMGINFYLALVNDNKCSVDEIWRNLFGTSHTNDLVCNRELGKEQILQMKMCVRHGFVKDSRNLFQRLDAWDDLFIGYRDSSPGDFQKELRNVYDKQLSSIPDSQHNNCLGVVVDGACASLPVSENKTLGDFVAIAFKNTTSSFVISDGRETVYGAAVTSYALAHGLPSYRETISPIEIHYHGKNSYGDAENAYKLLVEGKTVEAGSEYKSKAPVVGLKIKQGEKKLALTLRRSAGKDEFYFRKVIAEIWKKTQIDEEVKIIAHLRPGQGFAKVLIESVTIGVFDTMLNWRTMEDTEEPEPPPLAYLPEVSRVEADQEMWANAEDSFLSVIKALKSNSPNLVDNLRILRANKGLNAWPLADGIDEFRGVRPKGDLFRHYGVFPSDGNLSFVSDSELAQEFKNACAKRFAITKTTITRGQNGEVVRLTGTSSNEKKAIQQAVSWMYLSCPSVVIDKARRTLQDQLAQTPAIDLHTIGLCFNQSEDITLFFKAFDQRLLLGTTGVNNWLRACRNIVRFRDTALLPEHVSRKRLEQIVERIIRILKREIYYNNFQQIFKNCILTSLYLLKRRRYEKDFLDEDSETAWDLEKSLKNLLRGNYSQLSSSNRELVDITLKFLMKEASLSDIDISVLTG